MKHLTAALLCCLLLCGCAGESPVETTVPTETAPTIAATSPEGLYAPGSTLELQTRGAVRAYPLHISDAQQILPFGEGILVLSGEETTTLTLLTGEELFVSATMQLDFLLPADDPSLVLCGRELSFYDPVNRETLVLGSGLEPVSRVKAPVGLLGSPVLSADRSTLYYCTSTALKIWDLESGIRRTLKEMSYPGQAVAGIHLGGSIIHCTTEDRHLFLSTTDGSLLEEWEGPLFLSSTDSTYCASLTLGFNPVLVYSCAGQPQLLLPEVLDGRFFCLNLGLSALQLRNGSDGEAIAEYYDLTTGLRGSAVTLPSSLTTTAAAQAADGFVYLLTYDDAYDCCTLYRWDTAALAANETTVYAGDYAAAAAPLSRQMVACRQYAAQLGEQYGIEILVGEAAAAVCPWDYDLTPETQPALIQRELALLEARLSHYSADILAQTASNFSSLKLCLVRSVTGSAESGSLDAATGVQFLEGSDAYAAITIGRYGEQALYHELFHMMETHIFNYSIAFDQWEKLNPAGFAYDYGYTANRNRDSGVYLMQEHRAFIDTYSMSFPKEDRARIMEYAMLPGYEKLFEAPALQAKLKAICDGIREAYGLEKSEETFLWEQYLDG